MQNLATPTQSNTEVLDTTKPEIPVEIAQQREYQTRLREDPSVMALTDRIDLADQNTILLFGQEPSAGISKVSDEMLKSTKAVRTEECTEMLTQLTKIMDKFDIKEVDPEQAAKAGFLEKLTNKISNNLEKLFEKYDNMGKEVDKVYTILMNYQSQIEKSSKDLATMYDANIQFYKELERYIVAGDLAKEQIEDYANQLNQRTDISDQEKSAQIQKLNMFKDMLDQRIYDLRIAENVAMQACPMIQGMQMTNFNLQRKINSAFIITLPIFKQCIVQAINNRRAQIQAKALNDLDAKTNELLQRNATATANTLVMTTKMAGTSSVDIETLRNTYATIQQGISEAKSINDEMAQQRRANTSELENMKDDMKKKGFIG